MFRLIFVLIIAVLAAELFSDISAKRPKVKDKIVLCNVPKSHRFVAHCRLGKGAPKPCPDQVEPRTKVSLECKPYYEKYSTVGSTVATCRTNGTFDKIVHCIPECRRTVPDAVPLILNGWATAPENVPWNVVLFVLHDNKFKMGCGGTLVSEHIIITAAHCVWQRALSDIRVGFGIVSNNYTAEQLRNINKIIVPEYYNHALGNYGSDLAVLVLEEPVQFSESVSPACINDQFNLSPGSIGTVAGIGMTEDDTYGTLRQINLEVQSTADCIENQKWNFKKYITFTSLCAGLRNGSAVCNGDSGSGLVVPDAAGDKWLLEGLVSISPRFEESAFCNPNYYTIFTKLAPFKPWLHSLIGDTVLSGVLKLNLPN